MEQTFFITAKKETFLFRSSFYHLVASYLSVLLLVCRSKILTVKNNTVKGVIRKKELQKRTFLSDLQ